jgi:hypothetical protein
VLGFDGERPMQGFVQPGITHGRQIRTSGRRRSGHEVDPSCLLCAGEELLPLDGDADEGCQWKVQIDEGWTPYWDPQS